MPPRATIAVIDLASGSLHLGEAAPLPLESEASSAWLAARQPYDRLRVVGGSIDFSLINEGPSGRPPYWVAQRGVRNARFRRAVAGGDLTVARLVEIAASITSDVAALPDTPPKQRPGRRVLSDRQITQLLGDVSREAVVTALERARASQPDDHPALEAATRLVTALLAQKDDDTHE